MALFSSKSAEEVRPITQDRIIEAFTKNEILYTIDNDGDLAAGWPYARIYFMIRGEKKEILHVAGLRTGSLPMDLLEDAREFVADWNRTKLWPKCYCVSHNGEIRVQAEYNVDDEYGVTDAQLEDQVTDAIAFIMQFFGEFNKTFGNPEQE